RRGAARAAGRRPLRADDRRRRRRLGDGGEQGAGRARRPLPRRIQCLQRPRPQRRQRAHAREPHDGRRERQARAGRVPVGGLRGRAPRRARAEDPGRGGPLPPRTLMRPDALPVQAARSHAVLPPDAVAALFGEGYTWRGTERVEVLGAGRPLFVEARPGDPLRLVLDALDREALRASSPTLRGPRGALDAPAIGPIAPRLVLPTGLRDAWGLTDGVTTSVALGPLVLSHVRVETGEGPRVVLDRTVLLAAGTEAGTTARWLGSKGSVESAR